MESVLSMIGLASAVLLVVAIAVAWWEQTGARAEARRAPPSTTARPVSVDIELDALAAEATRPRADQAARRSAMGSAMARMARAPTTASWVETQPSMAGELADRHVEGHPGSGARP